VITNRNTGQQTTPQTEFISIKSNQAKEDEGSWYMVPGDNLIDPKAWEALSFTISGMKITGLQVDTLSN